MNDPDLTLLADTDADHGMLGSRRLVAVQLVDIGRLQSEVLPLPENGGLVVVTGRGPIDSNQSSKTTWQAAVDLLCMSHAWGPRSGHTGGWAEGLVLGPEGKRFASHRATKAYLLGGFRDGAAPHTPPLTVIACIDRSSDKKLRFRVLEGLTFAQGDSHNDRIADAARLWQEAARSKSYSAKAYLNDFLGGQPRSAGYVNRRGHRESPPVTLFTSDLSKVSPERIARDLLELTGLDEMVTEERNTRASAAARHADVTRKQTAVDQVEAEVEETIAEIDRRRRALAATRRARSARNAWLATSAAHAAERIAELAAQRQQLLNGDDATELAAKVNSVRGDAERYGDTAELDRAVAQAVEVREAHRPAWERAEAAVSEARTTYDQIDGRLTDPQLLHDAERSTGRSAVAVEVDLGAARVEAERAQQALGVADSKLKDARRHRDLLEGAGSEQVAAVRAAGVDAVALGDAVEIDERHRDLYDPLLGPWADAVVVAPDQLDAAASALVAHPGTVLLGDEPGALPEGVDDAPPHAAVFLRALAASARVSGSSVTVTTLPHRIVGGYRAPQVGQQARKRNADAEVDATTGRLSEAVTTDDRAKKRVRELDEELDAARAAARRQALLQERSEASQQVEAAKRKLAALQPAWEAACDAVVEAERELGQQQQLHDEAVRNLETLLELQHEKITGPAQEKLDQAASYDIERRLTDLAALTDETLPDSVDLEDPDGEAVEQVQAAAAAVAASALLDSDEDAVPSREAFQRRSTRELSRALADELKVVVTDVDGREVATAPPMVLSEVVTAYQEWLDQRARRESTGQSDGDDPGSPSSVAFAKLSGILIDWLEPKVESDEAHRVQLEGRIESERDELDAAKEAYASQQAGAEAYTASTRDIIESRLEQVAEAFCARVAATPRETGHLRVERVDPDDASKELTWRITPAWSRAPGDDPTPYHQGQPNTAQEKVKAIQLILAAFGSHGPPGRVLLLDELAAGLGNQNFSDVLAALANAAHSEGLTILATIQDTHVTNAVDHAVSTLFFRYQSTDNLLNDPTAVLAKGPDGALAELASQVSSGRENRWTPLGTDGRSWDGTSGLVPDDPSSLFSDDQDER